MATVMTVTLGAADTTWNNPEEGDYFSSEDIVLNVTNANSTDMSFWYDDGQVEKVDDGDVTQDGDYFYVDQFSVTSLSEGMVDLIAGNETSGFENETIEIGADFSAPEMDTVEGPTGMISDDSPEVSFELTDSLSGVNDSTVEIYVYNEDGDEVDSASGSSIQLDDLEENITYDVGWYAEDNVGNTADVDDEWSFTTDYTLEADLEITDTDPEPGTYQWSDGDEIEFTVEDVSEDVDWECRDSGGDTIDSGSGQDETLDCAIDTGEFSGTLDIEIWMEDEAGNSDTSETRTYTLDTTNPVWNSDPTVDLSTVQNDFEVTVDGEDFETSIPEIRYWYNDGTLDDDDKNLVDLEDSKFTADVSDLESGNHTMYVELLSETGLVSSTVKTLDFTFLPDAEPEVSLYAPSSVEVTGGESTDFDVELENTGRLLVEDVDVTAEGVGVDGSETIASLDPDDSINMSFEVAPDDEEMGESTIDVSSEEPESSVEVDLTVRASENQRNEIESTLEQYESELEDLRANVSALEEDGLSQERSERLQNEISSFETRIQQARSNVDEGTYYLASQELEGIEEELQTAQTGFQEISDEHSSAKLRRYGLLGLGGIIVVVAGVGGAFYMRDDMEFDIEQIKDSNIDVTNLGALKSRVNMILKSEEEAEEFEWDGFN